MTKATRNAVGVPGGPCGSRPTNTIAGSRPKTGRFLCTQTQTFDGEFAHHGAMAKTARGGVCDQPFVGVDQGPCDRRVIRAARPSKQGDPAAQACGPMGGPVGGFSLAPTGFLCRH